MYKGEDDVWTTSTVPVDVPIRVVDFGVVPLKYCFAGRESDIKHLGGALGLYLRRLSGPKFVSVML